MCNCSCNGQKDPCQTEKSNWLPYLPVILSIILLIIGLIVSTQWIWYILAYLPVGIPVMKEAWESICKGDVFNEFTLMSIATIGAFCIGEYPEGVAVMLFYTTGELFQDRAVDKVKRNIEELLDVRPETATVIRKGETVLVSPSAVKVGEILELKVGERLPLDGILLSDSAAFNTAALTGESVPRTIRQGEEALAGMIVTDKVISIEVNKPFNQSALARILELVQNATERKAPAEQFIHKFARIYTPIVTLLAVLIVAAPFLYSLIAPTFAYDFNDWLYRGLVFLVISCPCALVISVPLGYFGGIGAASHQGILFKGGNYLDAITQINTVVMDKTGTLTQGVFEVQKIVPEGNITADELFKIVASVEQGSTHPIAKAIVRHCECNEAIQTNKVAAAGLPHSVRNDDWKQSPEEITEIAGHGLIATLNGKQIVAGNTKLLDLQSIVYPPEVAEIPESTVLCAVDGVYSGYIIVADQPKEDAGKAIYALHNAGIKNIVMLSGDKQSIVSKLAKELGIETAYGNLLPEQKVEKLEELKANPQNKIAFVGDGINDAPALALSDIGIAMGGLGSDVAIETADVIIQTDQPGKIATAIQIGKFTRRIVLQNIAFALGVKFIVLILGAFGVATLWEAVFADVGVALLAVLNSVRILGKK
ncbi:cadmium/zinc/cobalt-transporting ATPase [Bacteroidia bacterium]|nr:cadmium/zinc/cobalt-transporting ATPase [Bacteroidia bacterium]